MYTNEMEERRHQEDEILSALTAEKCYCHVSMNSLHGARPCHFCEAEVRSDLWAIGQEADEQEALQAQLDALGALSAFEIEIPTGRKSAA